MKAAELYEKLDRDFVTATMSDNWYDYMKPLDAFLCDNFKRRSMGVMCDFAEEITAVYTAVFPSDASLEKIISDGARDAVLFLHHASTWRENAFHAMNPALLEKLRERRVTLFCYHVPLDNFGEFSTSKTLAAALGISIDEPFLEYSGALVGVIGKAGGDLREKYAQAVGHETKFYPYGESSKKVAVAAGGGGDVFVIEELIARGISALVTGITSEKFSPQAHALAKRHKINMLGGTHYSSEKFACIAICEYFEKMGLAAEFIHDASCLSDM